MTAAAASRRRLFDHPAGLWVLAGTEFWDRVSFHGMQALLVLYMVGQLLLPGHVELIWGFAGVRAAIEGLTGTLSVQALAAQLFGLYVGLVYFTPVIGGWLGDRLIGRRAGVVAGGLLMAAGHFALAFDEAFLIALLLLILGAGLLRGNLPSQIKALYPAADRRESDAFQLYYVAINIGAFIAPIVTGALAAAYSWHLGFAFAGVGMAIGVIVYLAGQRRLPKTAVAATAATAAPLGQGDRRRIAVMLAIWPLIMCFWIAQTQVWNVYNLWVRDHVALAVGGFQVPVPWLQAFDGLAPVIVMAPFLALWRWQAKRGAEPGVIAKIGLGCLIFAGGTAWLALAPLVSTAGRAPILWAIGFHLLSNIGWLYCAPTALALYGGRSPAAVRGTMLGVNYLMVFAASTISGRIGGFYETLSPSAFWLIHSAIAGAAGLLLLALTRPLERALREEGAAPASEPEPSAGPARLPA